MNGYPSKMCIRDRKYTDFTELTAPMIHEFVEKILVHAPDRSTGERVQEIEIYLNFIGKFEVPMPEPTEEELAAEEKRDRKSTRLNSSHSAKSRMPSSA